MTSEASNIAPAWNRAHSNLLDIKNSSTWTVSCCGHNHFLTPLDSTHHQAKSHLQELATKLAPSAWLMQSVKLYDLQAKLRSSFLDDRLSHAIFKWHRCKSDIESKAFRITHIPCSTTCQKNLRDGNTCWILGAVSLPDHQFLNGTCTYLHSPFLSLPMKWNWNH